MSKFRWARRIGRHLTRSQAIAAWAIAGACLSTYAIYQSDWPFFSTVRESSLILFSIALGAAFLPELSANLWNVRENEVRDLIPTERVEALTTNLIRAQIPESEWANHVLNQATWPLIGVGKEPHRVVADLDYAATVHPDRPVVFGGQTIRANLVEARVQGRRVMPASSGGIYWISVVRRESLLSGEFILSQCLYREVLDLGDETMTDQEWAANSEQVTQARIVLNGTPVTATTTPPNKNCVPPLGVLRWFFDPNDVRAMLSDGRRRSVGLELDYPLVPNRLTVKFGSYFVMGSIRIRVTVNDINAQTPIACYPFLASCQIPPEVHEAHKITPGVGRELSISSSDDSLFWPGSGVAVAW